MASTLRCRTEGSRGLNIVVKKHTDIADSFPINRIMKSNPLVTRREMLGTTGMAALTGLAGILRRQRSRCCSADSANTASYRLLRQLLGCSGITCGLDHLQADGRLLVAGRPHSFKGGCCIRLHSSV